MQYLANYFSGYIHSAFLKEIPTHAVEPKRGAIYSQDPRQRKRVVARIHISRKHLGKDSVYFEINQRNITTSL